MTLATLLSDWVSVVSYVGPPLCGWVWWSARQKFALKDVVEALSSRTAVLELTIKDVPDGQTMLRIQLALEELRGDMKAQDAKMDGVLSSVDALKNNTEMLIQHHLRDQ